MTKSRAELVLLAAAGMALLTLLLPPIPQNPAYHDLADRRAWAGIPNALDVCSNAGFLMAGVLGLRWSGRAGEQRKAYVVFFAGVALTALGSAYYHLDPGDQRLFWDRLPMTVGFTALLAGVAGERLSAEVGRRALLPLVMAGVASLLWWRWIGDLRFYGLVQYGSLVLIVLLLALPRRRDGSERDFAVALALYAIAKAFELADHAVFDALRIASGHTLKHGFAAAAVFWIAAMLRVRSAPSPAWSR